MTKFGFTVRLERYPIDLAISTAEFAESIGFDSLFVNDHYMKPRGRGGNNIPDAFLMLAAIAVQTSHITLGTAVTPITLRPAPQIAKIVATLDNISKGRFLFGIGAGNNPEEFKAYGSTFLPPRERVDKTIEGIRLIKRMWTEEEVTFKGTYYDIEGAILLPKPSQKPHPPILVGSESPRMCRFAAIEADGWIPSYLSFEDYKDLMNRIIEEAEKSGRNASDLMFVHFTRILTGTHTDDMLKFELDFNAQPTKRAYIVGTPEKCVQELAKFVDIGVHLILLSLHDIDRAAWADEKSHHEKIAFIYDEVLSKL